MISVAKTYVVATYFSCGCSNNNKQRFANVDECFDVGTVMCNVNVSRTGLLALVPHAPSLTTQLKAVAALSVVVEGYKATGKAEAIRASGQTSHSVAKILGHKRQAGANAVEFLVGLGHFGAVYTSQAVTSSSCQRRLQFSDHFLTTNVGKREIQHTSHC